MIISNTFAEIINYMNELILYLLRFLTIDPDHDTGTDALPSVGYTSDVSEFNNYDLVIIPSDFFNAGIYGTDASMPALPLREVNGIPLLYGQPEAKRYGKTIILYADLLASAYFLLTRYEEMVRANVRDEHGRFPGKESLPHRAGFIHRPVVDEYRMLIQELLNGKMDASLRVSHGISRIELTHDIDAPCLYRSWKGLFRSLILHRRGIEKSFRDAFGNPENDPYFTFPFLMEKANRLHFVRDNVRALLFFKAGGKDPNDKPRYNPAQKHIIHIARLFTENMRTSIGLHVSYHSGKYPSASAIAQEKKKLEKALDMPINISRHHFLDTREPKDMDILVQAGIKHDYTLGYADAAGFRLGTSFPVRWINPIRQELTDLLLHPLAIMDCTLESGKYMNMDYETAEKYCLGIIENISRTGGVCSLLWHNTSIAEGNGSYLKRLYNTILDALENE
jgi:hypothetical protein